MRILLIVVPLALLGSCVGPGGKPAPAPAPRPAPASPRPAPAPSPATPAPVSTEWQYRPVTPGNWTYNTDAAGPAARFGPPSGGALLSVRCDRVSRRISVVRAGMGQGPMLVRTSYGATSWPASAVGAPIPETVATRAASDSVLDQIAYSRGRFAVEVGGLAPLIVPAWAEVARVVEDCRG